jgi:hypothetical protein
MKIILRDFIEKLGGEDVFETNSWKRVYKVRSDTGEVAVRLLVQFLLLDVDRAC